MKPSEFADESEEAELRQREEEVVISTTTRDDDY
jgi:hypothetical protein